MTLSDKNSSKVLSLEALRGMASIIVVVNHFIIGFFPWRHGALPGTDLSHTLIGSPAFVMLNGTAMVIIFFVLSGYVLSLKAQSALPIRAIAMVGVKRWFRLVPLVFVSVLLSFVFYHLGAYHYEDAASLSGSEWLRLGAYSGFAENAQPGLGQVIRQGLWRVFVARESTLNTNLWTMTFEFLGSYMVLALALSFAVGGRFLAIGSLMVLGVLLSADPIYLSFLFGVLGTCLSLSGKRLGWLETTILLLCGLYFCGYYLPIKSYHWLSHTPLPEDTQRYIVMAIGAFFLLCVFATDNFVSRRFLGRVAVWVGKISFPLYVIHTLLILSVASASYAAVGGGRWGGLAAAVSLIITLPPLVALLTWMDSHWLRFLGRWR